MKPNRLLALVSVATTIAQASDPHIDSWITSRSGAYARIYTNAAAQSARLSVTTWSNGSQTQSLPAYSGVQEIDSSTDWVYLRTTGLGFHIMGPWSSGFPNLPANQHVYYRFPRNPSLPASGSTKTLTGNGTIGFFVDGVAMFDSRDAHYWNGTTDDVGGTGDWNREAYVNEGTTFDPAYAHQENTGTYHYHANPIALRYFLGDHVEFNSSTQTYSESTNPVTAHSAILGWVSDGFPIYGPYAYANATNPASGLKRMVSGYHIRNGEQGTDNLTSIGRKALPAWATRLYGSGGTSTGPDVSSTYPLGRYMEDNAYLGDLGFKQGQDFDLDEYNGRYCVTPEFPQGTYFVSIASDGTPVFPYNIGRAFYGTVTAARVTTVSETVTTNFLGGPDSSLTLANPVLTNSSVTLVWSAVEGGTYQVDSSTDLKNWTTQTSGVTPAGNKANATSSLADLAKFFRVSQTALASYDSVTNSSTNTGGGGGPGGGLGGGGPTLSSVTPTSGNRGTQVTLTMGLGTMAPPTAVHPTSATLGTIRGTNVSRSGSNVTATFSIPSTATPGAVNVSVVFPGPPGMGDVTFSLANGFTIK